MTRDTPIMDALMNPSMRLTIEEQGQVEMYARAALPSVLTIMDGEPVTEIVAETFRVALLMVDCARHIHDHHDR